MPSTETITIHVDSEAARAYAQASGEQRRKLQLLLSLRLRELTSQPCQSLSQIMDEVGAGAEAQGLTPDTLDRMLSER